MTEGDIDKIALSLSLILLRYLEFDNLVIPVIS